MTNTPPWAAMKEYDPDLHPDETDDADYHPTALTQSLMGAAIMLTIGLAFYGLTEIMQHAMEGIR